MKGYREVLHHQPHLRLINRNNISDRLLQRTHGTCFIAFNTLHQTYELHSTLSFNEECNSCNAVIDESWLNWRIVEDFLMNNHKKFGQEVQDNREYMRKYYEQAEEKRQFAQTSGRLGIVKRTLGRSV